MKRGDTVVVEVEALTAKGDGLGWVEGREVVVQRTVPGDRARVFLRRKRRGRFEGDADELLAAGMERQQAPCPHFGVCGGCRWQDLTYEDQLRLKEGMVGQALAGRGFPLPPLEPILASPEPFFYRNKMEFSFSADREGALQLGLHVRGRFNRVFDVEACHLQSPLSNRIVEVVRRRADQAGLPVYDLKSHEGLLRFLVVREGKNTGECMVNLVVSAYPHEGVEALVRAVLEEVPQITTFLVSLHTGKAQIAVGEAEFTLRGGGRIGELCGGLEFAISTRSFFQTNTRQAERLYALVRELAGPQEGSEVLDLFCGTGSIALHLAPRARRVVGVEVVEEAVEDARRNADRNGVANCEFVVGAAEEVLPSLAQAGRRFDLVVVDPPRAGVHEKALEALEVLRPRQIVYVSCNPWTLGDDLQRLCVRGGYRLKSVHPVDMFPQTPHCEAVAALFLD